MTEERMGFKRTIMLGIGAFAGVIVAHQLIHWYRTK
jgi:uncharacterized membrane protein